MAFSQNRAKTKNISTRQPRKPNFVMQAYFNPTKISMKKKQEKQQEKMQKGKSIQLSPSQAKADTRDNLFSVVMLDWLIICTTNIFIK